MAYRVLLTDNIDPDGVAVLTAEPELTVDTVPTLSREDLIARIGVYDALVARSATRVSREVLRAGSRLAVVGRAGAGVDNIAVDAATEMGIAVINAPAGNTVAVAELFFGSVLGLLRHIPQADRSIREGRWEKTRFMGRELRGRTLGIIGLGRIGGEIATRAHAFGMTVVAYDPYVGDPRFHALRVRRATVLDDMLAESSVLSVHTPLVENEGLLGERELSRLPVGAIVANLARGGIIDESALAAALVGDHLAGAVLDVFSTEPLPADHPLRAAPNVVLTPHIGASTIEAQRSVAVDVCRAVRDALLHGELSRSINAALVEGVNAADVRPALLLTRQLAAVAQALLASREARAIDRVEVTPGESLAGARDALLAAAAHGVLAPVLSHERLNLINARALAVARGIALSATEGVAGENGVAAYSLSVRVSSGAEEITVTGSAHPAAAPRITRIGAFRVDVYPRGTLLILSNRDVPGVIGHVGTVLGAAHVNIAEYHQARLAQGGAALAAITVDGPVGDDVRSALLALPEVHAVTVVELPAE
ncbi:MAG TPA: phosphoglycerate dehydrogenase [Gemmatimonadaceae bacterium]|jgi:D-3-phosphoglycerate dehydrogenase|nr:phosphoglycerate dehydrogenase [Gemmatimonadaceae bacterium]